MRLDGRQERGLTGLVGLFCSAGPRPEAAGPASQHIVILLKQRILDRGITMGTILTTYLMLVEDCNYVEHRANCIQQITSINTTRPNPLYPSRP